MKIDISKLRIAVIPTETDNGITQLSSVDEILACKELLLYTITDYFKAQNDEELGLHWSFLIDMETKTELNCDDVHGKDNNYKIKKIDKTTKINKIKSIVDKWGIISLKDLDFDPYLYNGFNTIYGTFKSYIERFYLDYVKIVIYRDSIEENEEYLDYDELSDKIIDDILEMALSYETMLQNLKNSIK